MSPIFKIFTLNLIWVLLAPCLLWGQNRPPLTPFSRPRIGKISINRKNVFATGTPWDHRFPYSWGNALHIVTREQYVRDALLFKEGDPYDEEIIQESERLLRSRPIFRYVTITEEAPKNGEVAIHIRTEDVWTTSIELSYGTAGGKDLYGVGVLENNLLGRGISAGAFVRQDIDRFVKGFSYKDSQLFGSRWEAGGGYGADEKGIEYEAQMERPFYSTLTRRAGGADLHVKDDEDRLFENGDEVAIFRHRTVHVTSFVSYAVKSHPERVERVSLLHDWQKDTFADFSSTLPKATPQDRTTSALQAGYEFEDILFLKARGIRTFDRDEDINLGWHLSGRFGPSLEALGATRDGYLGDFFVKKAWRIQRQSFLWLDSSLKGRGHRGTLENTSAHVEGLFIVPHYWRKNTAILKSTIDLGKNLDPENEFLLGGENGLRGYSVRQFSGNKKIVVNLENRRILMYDIFYLFNLGWAPFFDAGGVWKEGERPSFAKVKSDVGVGLRIATTRSVDPSLIRWDLAYALNENNRRSRWVFNIGLDYTFRFPPERKFDQ